MSHANARPRVLMALDRTSASTERDAALRGRRVALSAPQRRGARGVCCRERGEDDLSACWRRAQRACPLATGVEGLGIASRASVPRLLSSRVSWSRLPGWSPRSRASLRQSHGILGGVVTSLGTLMRGTSPLGPLSQPAAHVPSRRVGRYAGRLPAAARRLARRRQRVDAGIEWHAPGSWRRATWSQSRCRWTSRSLCVAPRVGDRAAMACARGRVRHRIQRRQWRG